MNLQESGEMYLETIYILSQKTSAVRSLDVAEYMNFSKPSVSRAVRLLKQGGYITVDPVSYTHLFPPFSKLNICTSNLIISVDLLFLFLY